MASTVQEQSADFPALAFLALFTKSALRIFMSEVFLTPQAKLDDRKMSAVVADGLGLLCSANLNFRQELELGTAELS